MEGVLEQPDEDEPHEMGDMEKKVMTDEEIEQFDEVRGRAMGIFSEVLILFIDCQTHRFIYIISNCVIIRNSN